MSPAIMQAIQNAGSVLPLPQNGTPSTQEEMPDAAPQMPPMASPAPAAPPEPQGDPGELLAQAKYHHGEAHRLHMKRMSEQEPTPEHHKTGLGIYLTSLLLSGLDPTHQAGGAFLNTYSGSKDQKEAEKNQTAQRRFLTSQGQLADAAKGEEGIAGGLEKMYSSRMAAKQKGDAAQAAGKLAGKKLDEAIRHDKAMEVGASDTRGAKKDHDADVAKALRNRDFYHHLTSAAAHLGDADPEIRKTASIALTHLIKDRMASPDGEGEDWTDLQKEAAHAFLTPSVKGEKMLADTEAVKARGKALAADQDLKKAKAARDVARFQTDQDTRNEKLKELKIKFPKDIEKTDATIAHIRAETQHLGLNPLAMDEKHQKNLERMYKSSRDYLVKERNRQAAISTKTDPANPLGTKNQAEFERSTQATKEIDGKIKDYDDAVQSVRKSMGMNLKGLIGPVSPDSGAVSVTPTAKKKGAETPNASVTAKAKQYAKTAAKAWEDNRGKPDVQMQIMKQWNRMYPGVHFPGNE